MGWSNYSQRRVSVDHLSIGANVSTLDSSMEKGASESWNDRPPVPTLLGYEVMEERAKFTVYKILVRRAPDESWVIFRRYTDFSRLHDKLKERYPKIRLTLPPKRWFKDKYDMNFLEERQVGLQAFLQNLLSHKDITSSDAVRAFLCLDDPPGPFDSLDESKAYCGTLEETNLRLQRELLDKQREMESLRRILEDRELQISALEKTNSICDKTGEFHPSNSERRVKEDVQMDINAAVTNYTKNPDRSFQIQLAKRNHAACWKGSASEDRDHVFGPQMEGLLCQTLLVLGSFWYFLTHILHQTTFTRSLSDPALYH